MPLALLVGYVDESEVFNLPIIESCISAQSDDYLEIRPEDVPVGDSVEDIENRRRIISQFYHDWKLRNPSLKKFN